MGLRSSDFFFRSRAARHCRFALRCFLVSGLICLGIASFLVSRIPWWVEQRLRASFLRKGYEEVELQVRRAAWTELELTSLRLHRPGWTIRAEEALLQFRPLAFLLGDYEILDLRGFSMELDFEELARHRTLRLPTSLRALHHANRYGRILLQDSQILLRRGGAAEELRVTGELSTQGPAKIQIHGEGVSTFSLQLQGEVAGDRGEARLESALQSPNLAALVEALAPGWLQKNPVYSVDEVELTSSFQITADRPLVTDASGRVHWRGWQFDNGHISPARVQAKKQGDAVVLRSETLHLHRDDGLAARGFVEATFAPEGSAEDTPFLQGSLHVESWSSPDADLSPFLLPFSGTPANLRLGPATVSVPGTHPRTLRELWVRLENPPGLPFRAEGKALLEVPLPLPVLSNGADPGVSICLPATGQLHGPRGERNLDFAIQVEDPQGNPLQASFGRYQVQLAAKIAGTLPPGPSPRRVPLQVDVSRMDWLRLGAPLLHLTGLSLSGHSRGGLLEAQGQGRWEGEPFPLQIRQNPHRTAPAGNETVATAVSLGPIPLREATWPGQLIKAWHGAKASGELSLDGTLLHARGQPASPLPPGLAFRLLNGTLHYPDGSATITGVQTEARLTSLQPLLAQDIAVNVELIRAGKLELRNLRLAATLEGPERVRIHSFEAGLLGGTIRIAEPVLITPEGPAYTVMFHLSRIQGEEAVRLFPKFKGQVRAAISGQVPVSISDGEVRFLEGHLFLDSTQPAYLSYDASGFLTRDGERTRAPKFTHSVERALGNFAIQSLDVRLFDPDDPSHPAIVKIAGTGTDGKLNLPVNLTIPVEDEEGILQSLFTRIVSAGVNMLKDQ